MTIRLLMTVAFAIVATPSSARAADDWPQFRGPNGQSFAPAANIPTTWDAESNVKWKTAVPGTGHSSPVIANGQIWLTTAKLKTLTEAEKKARLAKIKNPRGLEIAGTVTMKAVCIDAESGELLREIDLFESENPEPVHSLNSYASPTPVLAGGRLYCHFGTYGTACVDTVSGKVLWRNSDIHVDHQNGPGSSPILWEKLLLIHFDGIDQQLAAALKVETGEVAWKVRRAGEMHEKAEFQKAYCTPGIIEVDGRPLLISPAANWVYAYDPASGEEVWRANYGQLGFSTVPRPVFGHGMVYVCTSFIKSRLLAIRYDGSGDVTKTHVKWMSDSQIPQKPSLLLAGDELYFVSDNGVGTCLDAKTGEQIWRQRIGGNYAASPLFAGGNVYFFSQDGKTTVISAGREYTEVAVNQLPESIMASPAIVGSALILRTEGFLYRIEE